MKTLITYAFLSFTVTLFGAFTSTYAGDIQSQSIHVRSQVVAFYDLNLAKPADAQTLLKRIQGAARTVCRKSSVNTMDIYANIDVKRCLQSSYQDTVARIDSRFKTNIEKVAAMTFEKQNLVSKR